MTWLKAERLCGSTNSSHLVEIFTQEQQDFITQKAIEYEVTTNYEREALRIIF